MKLGFFTMPIHPLDKDWRVTLKEDREAFILADELGFTEAYCGEHVTDQAENITSCALFLSWIAKDIKRMRLGTGTINLPNSHPAAVAGQIAMLDHMLDGRFNFGISPGGLLSDAEIFGNLDADRNAMFVEGIDAVLKIWEGRPPYTIEGRFWKITTERTMMTEIGQGIIAKPLFLILRFIYEHIVSNWGWSILLLTIVLNVAMLPTRIQMMKSSLKMQRIQPEMEVIKAKYAKYKTTDPRKQEMQREIMDLQKREGVNMFGGCLPMLIQWPLLFGFYRMLGNVIELRQAHWLWLPDLSAPDPWHILPISVVISMFLTQYLTPSPGMDPAQQKMMAFTMPAVFGFMMWNYGSGLSLYWACGNFIGVATQLVINRSSMGREMRERAAKRAAKRTGGKIINARR